MAISFQYDTNENIVRTQATETVTTNDIIKYGKNIIEDKKITSGFVELVDFALVEDIVVRYSELGPFPSIWEKYKEKGCKATIIFAPTDISFGIFRMLQTVILMDFEMDEDHFVVVRSKEDLDAALLKNST
jgi:hypothetical protein